MSGVDDLRRAVVASRLMTEEAADGHYAAWRSQLAGADESPDDLVAYLVSSGAITQLHGEALSAGHTGPFTLGPYLIQEQIATSRTGGLFRAVHEEFGQHVSLKVFPRSISESPELMARMGREARIATEVDHPNVVRSFQIGRLGDLYYLALEPLHGETLADKLQREGRMPYESACRIVRDVAKGVAHLHSAGIVHRDLRPSNIWLMEAGRLEPPGGGEQSRAQEIGRPKIMEFGASVDALAYLDEIDDGDDDEFEAADLIVNKYDYMPPEQAYDLSCADTLSDIYSLGCVFYHCLTGRPPFIARTPLKKVLRHVYDTPQPPSEMFADIPEPLDDTVDSMLAKEYARRFQKAENIVWALEQFVPEEQEQAPVVIVEVNPQYVEWAQSNQASGDRQFSPDGVGFSAELSSFFDFMAAKSRGSKQG